MKIYTVRSAYDISWKTHSTFDNALKEAIERVEEDAAMPVHIIESELDQDAMVVYSTERLPERSKDATLLMLKRKLSGLD